jgi:hypothetical protein
VRPRPALFRALGHREPPDQVCINGHTYHKVRVFKHDSWAATAFYMGTNGRRVVCKFNRQQGLGWLPLHWIGHWLARREAALLRRLSHVPNLPRWSGDVYVGGVKQVHAVAHDFIPGHPLGRYEHVDDHFFPALKRCLTEMHRHDVAYVDLHKRENILVGADGKPYLLDFQISLALPPWWPANSTLTQILLHLFQRSDEYHLDKHVARCRPDQLGRDRASASAHRPWWIRLHRLVAVPFRTLRRGLLTRLGIRDQSGRVETEHFAEEVVRHDQMPTAA